MVEAESYMEELEPESINPVNQPAPFSYGSIPVRQIISNEHRLDVSAFNMNALNALKNVCGNRYGYRYLLNGDDGIIQTAYYPGRYKRIYCKKKHGIPFYLPSQLDEVYPKPTKYISHKTAESLRDDFVKEGTLLMSRSGTIGKCSIASKTILNKLFSDDVIRISFKNEYDLGYVYAYLNTETGLTILQSNNYGAVIDHIEPEHLRNIPIPNAPAEIRRQINDLILESFDLRDRSNRLIDAAQSMLYEELQLPEMSEIKSEQYVENAGFYNYAVKSSNLGGRLDASYHLPEIKEIIRRISLNAKVILHLGDRRITRRIFVGDRFKRVYVDKDQGVVYLNGKSINQLDPNGCNKKYLSFTQHGQQIKDQLTLKANYILVTCSGTLGKVVLVPKHWDGWAGTHDLIRVIPSSEDIAGYLFCFLNSEIGKALILRNSYGAVVDHIEPEHMARVPVPILKNETVQSRINSLVLSANDLRHRAYQKEQEALAIMQRVIAS